MTEFELFIIELRKIRDKHPDAIPTVNMLYEVAVRVRREFEEREEKEAELDMEDYYQATGAKIQIGDGDDSVVVDVDYFVKESFVAPYII